jgi:hypothetical protein
LDLVELFKKIKITLRKNRFLVVIVKKNIKPSNFNWLIYAKPLVLQKEKLTSKLVK